jgi:hypothetical protein
MPEGGVMTREEFGAAIAEILTLEQREQIQELHDQVDEGWVDGCAAHAEGANCCVDEIMEATG